MQPVLKPVIMLAPLTTPTNADTATARLDTLGYDWVGIYLQSGISDATTKPTTLKLSAGATTTAASATDITAFVGAGVGGFTIPAQDSTTPAVTAFEVDLRGRERYLFLTYAPAAVQNTAVLAILSRAEKSPAATDDKTTEGEANILATVRG